MSSSDPGFQAALQEARQGLDEGGIPIGACLVNKDGKILGRGHNMRVQKGSTILHVCSFIFYPIRKQNLLVRADLSVKKRLCLGTKFPLSLVGVHSSSNKAVQVPEEPWTRNEMMETWLQGL